MAYSKHSVVNGVTRFDKALFDAMEDGIAAANEMATTSTPGLMSAADKAKLDGIEAGATVGGSGGGEYTLPKASASVLGGVKVGTNLSIDGNGVLSATNTTYGNASQSAPGLMSAADKAKLDGIEAGATADSSDVDAINELLDAWGIVAEEAQEVSPQPQNTTIEAESSTSGVTYNTNGNGTVVVDNNASIYAVTPVSGTYGGIALSLTTRLPYNFSAGMAGIRAKNATLDTTGITNPLRYYAEFYPTGLNYGQRLVLCDVTIEENAMKFVPGSTDLNNNQMAGTYDLAGLRMTSDQGKTLSISKDTLVCTLTRVSVPSGSTGGSTVVVTNEAYSLPERMESVAPCFGKKILCLGDGMTSLGVSEPNRGWTKYFGDILKPSKVVNLAVSSATLADRQGTVYDGDPVCNGADNNVNNVLGNQVEKLLRGKDQTNPNYAEVADYEDFDIIMIAASTNDAAPSDNDITPAAIEPFFTSDGSPANKVALENVDRKTFAGAFRYCVEKLRFLYPSAKIFICTPIQGFLHPYPVSRKKGQMLKLLAGRMSLEVIDTFECGILDINEANGTNAECLIDGLHPNAVGAKRMGRYNARRVMDFYMNGSRGNE